MREDDWFDDFTDAALTGAFDSPSTEGTPLEAMGLVVGARIRVVDGEFAGREGVCVRVEEDEDGAAVVVAEDGGDEVTARAGDVEAVD